MTEREPWLGHRDWCALQWQQPCDCPNGPEYLAEAGLQAPPLNVLSLFAGIGGLELGLERAGMTTVGQVELDPYCRSVLAHHWPEVPRHDDVRTAPAWWLGEQRPRVDLVCGGFPCQPVSVAGLQQAQEDPRWLWPAFAGVVRGLRPRYVLVENVPGLLARGIGDVLGDLAKLGYDTEWDRVSAAFVGAPHLRGRIWIVATDTQCVGVREQPVAKSGSGGPAFTVIDGTERSLADSDSIGRDGRPRIFRSRWWGQPPHSSQWATEPNVGRVAHGVPHRMDRLKSLGNAVVPQVAEHIGRLIVNHHTATLEASA